VWKNNKNDDFFTFSWKKINFLFSLSFDYFMTSHDSRSLTQQIPNTSPNVIFQVAIYFTKHRHTVHARINASYAAQLIFAKKKLAENTSP